MTRVPSRWHLIALVVAAEILVLAYMVGSRMALIAGGREIVLDVTPVDPRSLFRGDYVILTYDISRIDNRLVEGRLAGSGPLHVVLGADADGVWRVRRASAARPVPGDKEVVVRSRPDVRLDRRRPPSAPVPVTYGIESYFVPEGEGRALETLVGEKRVRALVAVGRDGTAALKGLLVDGKLVHSVSLI